MSFAGSIPLEREAWERVNPLGGDFTNGTYVSLHSAAQGFEIAKGMPKLFPLLDEVSVNEVEKDKRCL